MMPAIDLILSEVAPRDLTGDLRGLAVEWSIDDYVDRVEVRGAFSPGPLLGHGEHERVIVGQADKGGDAHKMIKAAVSDVLKQARAARRAADEAAAAAPVPAEIPPADVLATAREFFATLDPAPPTVLYTGPADDQGNPTKPVRMEWALDYYEGSHDLVVRITFLGTRFAEPDRSFAAPRPPEGWTVEAIIDAVRLLTDRAFEWARYRVLPPKYFEDQKRG